MFDPNIIWLDISQNVRSFKVEYYPPIPTNVVRFFYSDDINPVFSAETLVHIPDTVNGTFTFALNRHINDLRIDLFEEAGFEIESIRITLNPVEFNFSFSRIVAVLLLYIGAKFLFGLQKIPVYTEKVELNGHK